MARRQWLFPCDACVGFEGRKRDPIADDDPTEGLGQGGVATPQLCSSSLGGRLCDFCEYIYI